MNLSFFCRRLRHTEPAVSKFVVLPETLQTYKQYILLDLQHSESKHLFVLKLAAVRGGIFHFQIDEKSPLSERYRVLDALAKEPEYVNVKVEGGSSGSTITVAADGGTSRAVVTLAPFKIDFYNGDKLVVAANSKGMMEYEQLRRKETKPEAPLEEEGHEGQGNEVQEVVSGKDFCSCGDVLNKIFFFRRKIQARGKKTSKDITTRSQTDRKVSRWTSVSHKQRFCTVFRSTLTLSL